MSEDHAGPFLVRARLRRDRSAQALARVLVPQDDGMRLGAAHSLVWALFADHADRRRDFLWREMRPGEFLILAARLPSDPHGLFDLDHKPFAPTLRPGQRLRFDLRVNPVTSVPGERGSRGRRRDVATRAVAALLTRHDDVACKPSRHDAIRAAAADWIARRAGASGFDFDADALAVTAEDWIRIPRPPRSTVPGIPRAQTPAPIEFCTLTLVGRLTVIDPPRFIAAIARGFGAAKAFGCGLMLIRRG